jgi:hypothetical protein
MRLLCEILVIGALIYLGWEKPFKEWIVQKPDAPVVTTPGSQRPIVRATAVPTQPGWMHDPNRRTSLDTPVPESASSTSPQSKPGSWMYDPNHRSPLDPPIHKQPSPH